MEPLLDPMKDRQVSSITPPPSLPLSKELLYTKGSDKPNWEELKDHFQKQGCLDILDCANIISSTNQILKTEPNLLRLKDPITVVGDIHGQYYDLLKLLEIGGNPSKTQYLFLGDYVDRGSFSIEVCLLLFSLKLNYPQQIWLMRGNHECRQMSSYFNFRSECEYKYNSDIYDLFMECFDSLPVAAVINGRFFAVHGGLSPELKMVSQLLNFNRFLEPPRSGLFCDLLWADPANEDKTKPHSKETFFPNEARGCSYFFGYKAACDFLERNSLLSIIRAHEAQLEGYKIYPSSGKTGFPTVITLFSAPNYCDIYNNKGAIIKLENNTLNIQQFNFSPHPYHLPNFMDVFSWSLPFLTEKVSEIFFALLKTQTSDDIDDEESLNKIILPPEIKEIIKYTPDKTSYSQIGTNILESPSNMEYKVSALFPSLKDRAFMLRTKVQTVGRLMRVFRTLRQEREIIVQLKDCTPANRIPVGLLLEGRTGLTNELEKFNVAKSIDAVNEMRPNL